MGGTSTLALGERQERDRPCDWGTGDVCEGYPLVAYSEGEGGQFACWMGSQLELVDILSGVGVIDSANNRDEQEMTTLV